MDAMIFLIIFGCTFLLGIAAGIVIGFRVYEHDRCAGDLVIAPGDADAPHYMFLELAEPPEHLKGNDTVLLRVRDIEARK